MKKVLIILLPIIISFQIQSMELAEKPEPTDTVIPVEEARTFTKEEKEEIDELLKEYGVSFEEQSRIIEETLKNKLDKSFKVFGAAVLNNYKRKREIESIKRLINNRMNRFTNDYNSLCCVSIPAAILTSLSVLCIYTAAKLCNSDVCVGTFSSTAALAGLPVLGTTKLVYNVARDKRLAQAFKPIITAELAKELPDNQPTPTLYTNVIEQLTKSAKSDAEKKFIDKLAKKFNKEKKQFESIENQEV